MAVPIRIGVGRNYVRKVDLTSSGNLTRELNKAFGEISGNFGWYVEQLEGFLPQDLYTALEPTFEKTQVLVPKDTGDLADSGYLEIVGFRGNARVEMGYGRNNLPDYAIYVHEVPMRHESPTRDKFVQIPVEEDYYKIIQRVTDIIRVRAGAM